ncbi:nucleotidyltransferase family protein [Methanothrix harundinacea]|uniref:DNA polymerase beta domain protein region n=1 Tax=Methanothrix harundinacea (strain 6Ac) TaxID=1110509 RepID=G7WPJ3_METH6|nr:nucleotidyltransferase domain-containing protein [Methanothrix harundinacea]AET65194.1 DNA polymerase beta domain protein region [Methanothrix harundinacea 6Ac]
MDEESDIDILIEFEGIRSHLDFAHLKNELEDAVNRRVDLLTCKSLHARLKDRILAEQIPILKVSSGTILWGRDRSLRLAFHR